MVDISASMAAQLSDLDDQKSRVTIQMEGHTLTPQNSQNGPKETEASSSALSHSFIIPVPGEKAMPDCPETLYCLEIQVFSTKDGGTTPHPHAWQGPVVKDMLQDSKSGLTGAVVMGPGWAILFYGRQSLGEELSFSEAWDTMFILSGAISWVGKQAQLNANVISLWKCWWMIAQVITKQYIEARGPGHPCLYLPVLPPFSFCNQDRSPQDKRLQSANECMEESRHSHQTSHHDQGWVLQHSQDCG